MHKKLLATAFVAGLALTGCAQGQETETTTTPIVVESPGSNDRGDDRDDRRDDRGDDNTRTPTERETKDNSTPKQPDRDYRQTDGSPFSDDDDFTVTIPAGFNIHPEEDRDDYDVYRWTKDSDDPAGGIEISVIEGEFEDIREMNRGDDDDIEFDEAYAEFKALADESPDVYSVTEVEVDGADRAMKVIITTPSTPHRHVIFASDEGDDDDFHALSISGYPDALDDLDMDSIFASFSIDD